MNQKIREHLANYAITKGWGTDEDSLVEILTEANAVYTRPESKRRHWNDVFKVVSVAGMHIGFMDATTTGDDSPNEKGREFDKSTIVECERTEKTVVQVTYVPITH